jgi:hypothetical protein
MVISLWRAFAAWEDAQRAFVERLEREAVPEWQVGQAARAVELYQKQYA